MSLSGVVSTPVGTISSDSGKLEWWGILLIIIGCILVATIGMIALVWWTKRRKERITAEDTELLKAKALEELEQEKKNK